MSFCMGEKLQLKKQWWWATTNLTGPGLGLLLQRYLCYARLLLILEEGFDFLRATTYGICHTSPLQLMGIRPSKTSLLKSCMEPYRMLAAIASSSAWES